MADAHISDDDTEFGSTDAGASKT